MEILPKAKLCGTGGLLYHNSENELKHNTYFDACLLNFTTNDIVKYFKNDFSHIANIVYRNESGKIVRTINKYHNKPFSYSIPVSRSTAFKKISNISWSFKTFNYNTYCLWVSI